MIALLALLSVLPLDLIPLDALPFGAPTPSPTRPGRGPLVYPEQGQGMAAYILGGFFGLGLTIAAAVLISMKPKRARPDPGELR